MNMYEYSGKVNAYVCNSIIEAWGEVTYGMHARRSDPSCIRRHNRECLLFNVPLALRSFSPNFGDSFGSPDGDLLLNFDGSAGSQDLHPAPRDSWGEPPMPGPKNSEKNCLDLR